MAEGIRDYLDLDETRALAQWRRIRRRTPPPPGRRQEDFLPVEVLLCYGLFFVLNPHRFGGANIDKVPEAVKALARTFRRSAGSITSKMLNLDNSRRNAGKLEVELYIRLGAAPDVYPALYRRVLAAARAAGFSDEEVPDFLELDRGGEIELLAQEEIGGAEIEIALAESAEEARLLGERGVAGPGETERLIEQRVRIGQHRFARAVLDDYGHRCGFCGFSPGDIEGSRLLTASHIKPWRDSTPRERLDRRNGVAACPTHDAAFDGGLLTVNGGLKIRRAVSLDALRVREPTVERVFGDEGLRSALVVPPNTPWPRRAYLQFHRDHVFRRA